MVDHRFTLKKIQSLKDVIILCFQPTRMPYVECDPETFDDQVHVFGDDKEAEEFVKSYREKKHPVALLKVPQKHAPMFLSSYYLLGVNALVYHDNGMATRLQLEQVVKKPKVFEEQQKKGLIPLTNPSLQLSIIYFLEEMYRQVEHDMKHARELEEEMVANLVRSKFIVASKAANEGEAFDPKNPEQKKVINYIKDKEGQIFLPVFSDIGEFQKFYKEQVKGMGMLVMPFHNLRKHILEDTKAIILNPAGVHLQIVPEQMDKLIKSFPPEEKKKEVQKEPQSDLDNLDKLVNSIPLE